MNLINILSDNNLTESIVNSSNLLVLIGRFLLNSIVTILIVHFIYFKSTGKRSFVFTFILISTTVFFLCFLLGSVDLQLGFALGLFAIFGIIRYRTDAIAIREMTYLFLVITISVINALARAEVGMPEVIFTNIAFLATTWIMEKVWMKRHLARRTIVYDRIDLLHHDKHKELISDIYDRTGIKIVRFKIGQIDFPKYSVRLTIFYNETDETEFVDDYKLNDKDSD